MTASAGALQDEISALASLSFPALSTATLVPLGTGSWEEQIL